MKKCLFLVLLVGLVSLGMAGIDVFAQAEDAAQEMKASTGSEESEFAYGLVDRIDSNQLVLAEYDYDTNNEVNTAYSLTEDTKIEGIEEKSGISAGDGAEIEYENKDGKKIAKTISIEKQSLEGEINEDMGAEGAAETKTDAAFEEIKIQ